MACAIDTSTCPAMASSPQTSSHYTSRSAPSSPTGMRRSTLDLGQLRAESVHTHQDLASSVESLHSLSKHSSSIAIDPSSSIDRESSHPDFLRDTTRNFRRGIESIIEHTFLDILPMMEIASIFNTLVSFIVKPGDSRQVDCALSETERKRAYDDDEPDELLLSPCRVKITRSTEAKDDWDHFADFQDDMEDNLQFVPLAQRSTGSLGTLDESEEEESDDYFF